MRSKLMLVLFSALLIFTFRVLPHPWNLTPTLAFSAYIPTLLPNPILSALAIVLGLLLGDFFLGFYPPFQMLTVYACFILPSLIMRYSPSSFNLRYLGAVIGSGFVFYLVSNFLVWYQSGFYTYNYSGLIHCYVLALPFYGNQLLGDYLWSGAFLLLHHLFWKLSPQPEIPSSGV
jgi:hypothetical protein